MLCSVFLRVGISHEVYTHKCNLLVRLKPKPSFWTEQADILFCFRFRFLQKRRPAQWRISLPLQRPTRSKTDAPSSQYQGEQDVRNYLIVYTPGEMPLLVSRGGTLRLAQPSRDCGFSARQNV